MHCYKKLKIVHNYRVNTKTRQPCLQYKQYRTLQTFFCCVCLACTYLTWFEVFPIQMFNLGHESVASSQVLRAVVYCSTLRVPYYRNTVFTTFTTAQIRVQEYATYSAVTL